MNIVHCCLSNFYIDNYNYQENVLPIMNRNDGHQVAIIASTESFIENSKIGYIKEGNYYSKEGIKVYRVKYRRYLPQCIMKKVRSYNNVYKILDNLSPDVIFFHGIQAFELLTVAKYKSLNPHVKFYVDSHAYSANSATNWISEKVLHRWFYKKDVYKRQNLLF